MLPIFQIYGLRYCSADAVPRSDVDSLMDVELDHAEQYDQLISESPETTLSYVDDDDGEIITVGSSAELLDRTNELPSSPPAVFDLLVTSEPARSQALQRWNDFLHKPSHQDKGKGKATDDPPVYEPTSNSNLLVDLDESGPAQASSSSNPPREVTQSFWANFEDELSKIMHEKPTAEPEAEPRVYPGSPPVTEPVPSPGEVFTQALEKINWVTNTVRRIGTGLSAQPPSALPVVEKLTRSLQTTMAVLTTQLHHVALEAAQKTRQAAQQSRDVDLAEIEAAKARIQSLALSLGRLAAQSAVEARNAARDIAGDVRRDVRQGVGEGFGAVAESARTVAAEMGNAGREIGRAVEEVVSKGKGRESPVSAQGADEAEKSGIDEPEASVEPRDIMKNSAEFMRMMQETFSNNSNDSNKENQENAKEENEPKSSEEEEVRNFWQQMNKIASNTSPAESSHVTIGDDAAFNRDAGGDRDVRFRMDNNGPHPRRRPFSWHPHGMHPGHPPRRHHRPGGRRHGPPSPPSPPPFENGPWPRHVPSPPPPPHVFPCGPPFGHGFPPGLPHHGPRHPRHHFRPHPRFMPGQSSPPPPPRSPPMPEGGFMRPPSPPSPPFPFNAPSAPPPPPPPPFYPPPPPAPRPSINGHPISFNQRYSLALPHMSSAHERPFERTTESANVEVPVRGLRRAHTVIGSQRLPPPAPFTAAADLSRSISPAPAMPPIPSPGQHVLHRFPSLATLQRMDESGYRAEPNAPSNPFDTPPRIPSPIPPPQLPAHSAPIEVVEERSAPSPVAEAVLVPAPPPAEPFLPSPVHRASTEPVHHLTNPFSSDRVWFTPSVPGRFPSPEPEAPLPQEPHDEVDMCVAQLVEMGFGEDGNDGVSGLRFVAEATNGDVSKAIEMMEEQQSLLDGS